MILDEETIKEFRQKAAAGSLQLHWNIAAKYLQKVSDSATLTEWEKAQVQQLSKDLEGLRYWVDRRLSHPPEWPYDPRH